MDNRKNNGGHSTKGFAGRKPKLAEIKAVDLASPYVEDSFRVLAEIMLDESKRPSDRITSAKVLIEYACGKPKETVEQNVNVNNFDIKDIFNLKEVDENKS